MAMSDISVKKMAKTGKNFGLYMQDQLLLGIVPRLVSFQLYFLIHVIDLFMEGEAVLELTSDYMFLPKLCLS